MMRRFCNKYLCVTLAVCAIAAAACGPKTYNFIKLDHPRASEHLLEEVALYYEGEPLPKGTNVITHIELTDRNTDCETAATIAIVKMQKQARFKGGDALINLQTKATGGEKGEPTHNEKGFWCTRMNTLEGGADLTHRVWEITWEGDIAILGEGLPEVEEEAADEEEEKGDKEEEQKAANDKEPDKEDKPGKKPEKEEKEEEEEGADDSDMVFEPSDVEDADLELEDSDDIY
ncbi:MAG: hypothetical protein ABIJ56_19315 [Pseudomonadota bacterium]